MPDQSAPPRASDPPIDLQHMIRLTDDTGLFQHAIYTLPDPKHGYCIDDNARALLLCVRYLKRYPENEAVAQLCRRYLTFVTYAFNADIVSFRNFMSYDRKWLEQVGSEDSQGRAAWSLGETVRDSGLTDVQNLAGDLFRQALPGIAKLGHIRSWAFALLGLNAYLEYEDDYGPAKSLRDRFAKSLHGAYRHHATPKWPWWEQLVTYDNAKLCQAMWETGKAINEPAMCRDAETALDWLIHQQTEPDEKSGAHLSIIGNQGWFRPGMKRTRFDQQPLEAWALTAACMSLAHSHEDSEAAALWRRRAQWCFGWFTGQNDLGFALADPKSGGCCDGIQESGPNQNQGAESTLSYLLASLVLLE